MTEPSGSRHLVDPELLPLLDAFPTVAITAENLAELRARDLPFPPVGDCGVELQERMISGPDGSPEIPVRIYRPREATGPLGCIYHIHAWKDDPALPIEAVADFAPIDRCQTAFEA